MKIFSFTIQVDTLAILGFGDCHDRCQCCKGKGSWAGPRTEAVTNHTPDMDSSAAFSMDYSEAGQTERVSADLLATSVSKSVLAKEVLRLKQVAFSPQHSIMSHA